MTTLLMLLAAGLLAGIWAFFSERNLPVPQRFGLSVAVFGAFIAIGGAISSPFSSAVVENLDQSNSDLRARLDSVSRVMDRQLAAIAALAADSAMIPRDEELEMLKTRVAEIDDRVVDLHNLFLTDAQATVTLPLLRQEIESMRSEVRDTRSLVDVQTRMMIEAQYQTRWIVGAVALGILGLIISVGKIAFAAASARPTA